MITFPVRPKQAHRMGYTEKIHGVVVHLSVAGIFRKGNTPWEIFISVFANGMALPMRWDVIDIKFCCNLGHQVSYLTLRLTPLEHIMSDLRYTFFALRDPLCPSYDCDRVASAAMINIGETDNRQMPRGCIRCEGKVIHEPGTLKNQTVH